jgi:hypothetical protein
MGVEQSTPAPSKTDGGMYSHLLKRGGGNDIDVENLSTLKNYENSIAGKTKENTIRKIARAMKNVGMNINPEDEDLDKIIKDLNKEIPNPKKGKTFAANAKTHAKVCKSVAKVLNQEFSESSSHPFIDVSGSPVNICRSVGELTHSLNQGVNTEFLGVIGSVKNALHAINLMDQVMSNMYSTMQKHIKSADNSYVDREISPLHEIYTKAKHEKEQKKMVLENLLHIHLEPASEALKHALDEHSRDAALVKKIGLTPGSSSMSDAIASTLTGVGTTTTILNRAHKALKVVGKTMNDYLNSHSFKDFEKQLSDIVEEGKMSPKQLEKFISATDILREGFSKRNELKIKQVLAQGGNVYGGGRYGGRRNRLVPGQDEDAFGVPIQSSMRSRASGVIARRSIINRDFVSRLDGHYNELLEAILAICKELGKSIPLTENTRLLKDSLEHLQNHNGNPENNEEITLEIVITHGIDTVQAREIKESYINKLKMIANICNNIMSIDVYRNTASMFSKVKDIILKIEKIINYYSSTVTKNNDSISNIGIYDNTYSKSIHDPQNSAQNSVQNDNDNNDNDNNDNDNDNTVVGGNDYYQAPLDYDINTPLIAKTGLTLNEIINTFNYYYYIAGVRNNLKIYSKEYDIFGEDYSNMLGNSIAKRLYELEKNYIIDIKTFIQDFDSIMPEAIRKQKEHVRKWIDDEYNIKIKFYKALQALDLYLKEFTPAISSNIDAVKEIKSMLDETQVIARWYNESTGDFLVSAFENLPGAEASPPRVAGPGIRFRSGQSNKMFSNGKDHYYKQIHSNYNTPDNQRMADIHFGDPLYSRDFENYDKPDNNIKLMKKHVEASIDHFQALKNIINTFIRIGNKFGTTDLSTKIFMSPSQIYKILFNYLKQSALKLYVPTTHGAPKSVFKENRKANVNNEANLNLTNLGIAHINYENKQISSISLNAMGERTYTERRAVDNMDTNNIPPYTVYFTGNANNLGDVGEHAQCLNNYEIEDKFFHLMIKAMAGKIMTVVGSYDMLEMAPPKHWITDTRMILGGNKKRGGDGIENPVSFYDNLEIIPEALPLYFKLPRLIEFYREILGFDINNQKNIAFLPDLDGLFTQLFLLIFRKSKTPENGDYSDSELHKMVGEINNIYNYYAKQKNTGNHIVTSIIQDIVIDINRKYGLIKKEDFTIWLQMTKEKNNVNGIKINNTNYSILPDENEFEVNTSSPSDIYKTVVNDSVKIIDHTKINGSDLKTNLLTGNEYSPFSAETPSINDESNIPNLDILRAFREKLDNYFKDTHIQNMTSYTILVHQAEDNIKRAKTNKEKISIVFQLIQGTGNLGIKNDKAMLFHETIIAGLNTLGAIELLINKYFNKIKDINPFDIEKRCMDLYYKQLLQIHNNPANHAVVPHYDVDNKHFYYDLNNQPMVGEQDTALNAYFSADPANQNSRIIFKKVCNNLYFNYYTEHKHIIDELGGLAVFGAPKDDPLKDIKDYLVDGDKEPVFRGSPIFARIGGNLANAACDINNEYFPRNLPAFQINDTINHPLLRDANMPIHIGMANIATFTNVGPECNSVYHISHNVLTNLVQYRLFRNHTILFKKTNDNDGKYMLPSEVIEKDTLKIDKDNIECFQIDLANNNIVPIDLDTAEKFLLKLRTISRISVNYQKIMETLLEEVFSLVINSNGLIDLTFVKIENNKTKLNLNFIKLQNIVNGLITDLKYYLEYFRPFIKPNIIKKYEDIRIAGSIYYIENKFNELFNTTIDLYDKGENNTTYSIENVSIATSNVFLNLTRDTLISFYNLSNECFINNANFNLFIDENINNQYDKKLTSDRPHPAIPNYIINQDAHFNCRHEWYGNTLSNLIFYDFSKKEKYIYKEPRYDNLDIYTIYPEDIPINGTINSIGNPQLCYYGTADPNLYNNCGLETVANNIFPQLYLYNAVSLFFNNAAPNNDSVFDFNEYIQYSACRDRTDLPTIIGGIAGLPPNYIGSTQNIPMPMVNGPNSINQALCIKMEKLDTFSYPKNPSSKTGNYSYNSGVYGNKLKEPICPSNDTQYKLSILIAKAPKDNKSSTSESYKHLIQWPSPTNIGDKLREYGRLVLYNDNCLYNDKNSLMFIFNQILSRYLNAFIDPSTGNKIYKNLLNSFVNGVASKITSSPNLGFPDMVRTGTQTERNINYVSGHNSENNLNESNKSMYFQKSLGVRGDIKEESIIFQSLAYILQRISKDIDTRNNINIHLLNTLTDVPLYMKESYKANLPSFIKIFDFIIQKSEFLKNIIQKTNINLSRYNQCDFANFINSCTGLTDVRINEVRYELHTYQIMNKFYLGRSLFFQRPNNPFPEVFVNAIDSSDDLATRSAAIPVMAAIPAGSNLDQIDNQIPYIELEDSIIDNIYFNRIMPNQDVKISCTRGTRGYNLVVQKYPNTPLPNGNKDGANYNFLKITDNNANTINGFLSVEGLKPFTSQNNNTETGKIALTSILDSIIAHTYTLSSCADEVLKELGDTPVYFETFDGSIENYKARNNNDQLMPLSLSLWFLTNNHSLTSMDIVGPTHTLFGGYNLGTNDFKMLYGIRQLFGKTSEVAFEQIPGVKTLLNHHNSSASDNQIDETKYLQFINRLVTGLRFVVDIHGYKKIVAYNSNNVINLIDPGNANANINEKNAVFALGNGNRAKEHILQILEDSYQENSINKLLRFLGENQKSISRKIERIKVIIDSSINPINVHALMQDIPLANIYNYAYTF